MPTATFELIGRKITQERLVRRYWVEGCTDETEVRDFYNSLPAAIAGYPKATYDAEEQDEIVGDFELEVTWGTSDSGTGGGAPSVNTGKFKFNYQMPSAKFYQSLATIDVYHDPALLAFGPPDFGGGINVVNDGGKLRNEGQDIQPPSEVFTAPYRLSNAKVTTAWRRQLMRMCGTVNNTTFEGAAPGELLLVRVAGGPASSTFWDIELGFGYIENDVDIPVGEFSVDAKDGWDLLWYFFRPQGDTTAKTYSKRPAAAYVERVFKRNDFNALALPAL
jgi:hypothetical protein